MVHGQILLTGTGIDHIQILIHVTQFGTHIIIKCPIQPGEGSILIEPRLPPPIGFIGAIKHLIPSNETEPFFKFKRMHEANHLPWSLPDFSGYKIAFPQTSEGK